ncbi:MULTISPECIES: nucleotidyltransferase family protein [Erwiniaceae]|uniref:nucleotidyltransferase family protein n=1 Tax=Erwiniaceae TaxID=1903409 RepID=UPI00190B1538|nr:MULTISPECIES: nucleotidyltransferase family protein [Erwiniaceae]MBK0091244.1 nucleotidyltransferase family protein [Erwinia sp. S59]MBK0122423.1 nucleotidyltransferase family protein [Pantoea sp. S61]MBK0122868.1 nucleotidyltransferase family protein [Pantoea sp. S61]
MKFAILIMAAGLSQRFRKLNGGHKLRALLQDKPVLQHTLEQAIATEMDVYVVSRPEDRDIHLLASRAKLITVASNGLGHSIAAGVAATSDYDGWLIVLGDMPLLTTSSYLAVARALQTSPLVRSEVQGMPGHPVGFQKPFYAELIQLEGDNGARALLSRHPVTPVKLTDLGCLKDVDTPAMLSLLAQRLSED